MAAAAATLEKAQFTPEQVDAWDDGVAYEVDEHGRLIERNMGAEADFVAGTIHSAVSHTANTNRTGFVFGGGVGLKIFPGRPRRMPRGDVVYISRRRLPRIPRGLITAPPELIIEVVSPGDTAEELNAKAHEYLAGGVDLVWVVYPSTRTVMVFRADGTVSEFGAEDTITGEHAFPEFSAKVASFFALIAE